MLQTSSRTQTKPDNDRPAPQDGCKSSSEKKCGKEN